MTNSNLYALPPWTGKPQVLNWEFKPDEEEKYQRLIKEHIEMYPEIKNYNTFIFTNYVPTKRDGYNAYKCTAVLFRSNTNTRLYADNYDKRSEGAHSQSNDGNIKVRPNNPLKIENTESTSRIELSFMLKGDDLDLPIYKDTIEVERIENSNKNIILNFKPYPQPSNQQMYLLYSTICPTSHNTQEANDLKNYIGSYDHYGYLKAFINLVNPYFNIRKFCNGIESNDEHFDDPPQDPPILEEENTCSNAGQFGGGGTPLKDIKLFLYANNVTKGTIKLSKPQVEVGTFATDWRPNPSDYVHVNNSNFKRINGIAMQHSDVSGKTFLEIQAKDGTVFGIDTWGGTQKLLEQQQAEIEELKKLVQTLETKINV